MAGITRRPLHGRAMHRGLVLAALAVAAAVASIATSGQIGALDGPLYDLALAGAAPFARPAANEVSIAVVALDRRSLASDELAEVPRVLMAPQWATLIDALAGAKPRAIGFDVIFGFAA